MLIHKHCHLCVGILTNPMDVITARLMTQDAASIAATTGANVGQTLWESRIGPTMATTIDTFCPKVVEAVSSTIQSAQYKGLRDCACRMAREEGVGAFFAGVGARLIWIAPFTALSLSLNEALRRGIAEKKNRAQLIKAPK
jgi:hypothetical protein